MGAGKVRNPETAETEQSDPPANEFSEGQILSALSGATKGTPSNSGPIPLLCSRKLVIGAHSATCVESQRENLRRLSYPAKDVDTKRFKSLSVGYGRGERSRK